MHRFDRNRRTISTAIAFSAVVVVMLSLIVSPVVSRLYAADVSKGWRLEPQEPPSFAVIDPASTNLNIDSVVLVCGELQGRRGLQLELYLSTPGPLLPDGATADQLNRAPRVEVVVDEVTFAADIFFADEFFILVDQDGDGTMVSNGLLDALERGRTMIVRFDVLMDVDPAEAFDGELRLDLQAGQGGKALAKLRRCVSGELWARR